MTDTTKRPRGRPPSPDAKARADIQRQYRERRKAAGKVIRVIDTWTTMTPTEIAELRERLDSALLKLELCQQDVARLEARNAHLESELKRTEQHHTNALKEIVTLKQASQPAPRTRRRAPG
jgi:chromosome segregation ATPase